VLALAWQNAFQNRRRAGTAVGGIAFSILLIFVQLGFLAGAARGATSLYHRLDFDIAMVAKKYLTLADAADFPASRVAQVRATEGLAQSATAQVVPSQWEDPASKRTYSLLLIGLDPQNPWLIQDAPMRRALGKLTSTTLVATDLKSQRDVGNIAIGSKAKVNGSDVDVVDSFELGMAFYAEVTALSSTDGIARLTGASREKARLGLFKVEAGRSPAEVVQRMRSGLPKDVLVFTRDEFIGTEADYFLSVKPVGILFRAGSVVGFTIGLAVLFQVLSTEIQNRLREYATLRAIGFSSGFVQGVGVAQALVYGTLGYAIATTLAFLTFFLVRTVSGLPMEVTLSLLSTVAGAAFVMSLVSALIALERVRRADPAELF